MTNIVDLEPFVNGDDIDISLRFIDDDDGVNIDVGGDTLYLTFKTNLNDSDSNAALQIIYTIPFDTSTAVGVVNFIATSEQTSILAGTYFYDFQWVKTVSGGGEKNTILYGKAKVLDGVTKS